MAEGIVKTSEIKITVGLDENHVPEKIHWNASDGGIDGPCNAFMLSVWDAKEENTLRIDLWNKEMKVDDMKKFAHQTLATMADTFERATGEKEAAKMLTEFSRKFAEELKLIG
ncbi:MAG: gliding motility protein GldC [Flavobacteriales bacterium]